MQEKNDNSSPEEESKAIEAKNNKDFEYSIDDDDQKTFAEAIENTRSGLANKLLYLLIGTYIFSFIILIVVIIYPVNDSTKKSEIYTYSKDIITLLITTQTGLVGTALGFYFGSRNK